MRQSHIYTPALLALFAALILPLSACAASKPPPAMVQQNGALPSSGRVVLRSGLSWMDEQSVLFTVARHAITPQLEKRGLTVVQAAPSKLEPIPNTPTPSTPAQALLGVPGKPDPTAGNQHSATEKTAELVKSGTLPKAKVHRYDTPTRDADLPASVMAIVPKDPYAALFALSQQDGMPLLRRGGTIPGRLPHEISTTDPEIAEYALVVRFSVVRPTAARSNRGGEYMPNFARTGGVSGIPSLGYGASAPSAPPRPAYGGTPGDYARGYEYGNRNDTWHRQHDMNARDYILRTSPPAPIATPPSGGRGPLDAGSAGSSNIGTNIPGLDSLPQVFPEPGAGTLGFALEMECYSLIPVRQGKAPQRIWSSTVHQRADSPDFASALPEMILRALSQK